MLYLPRRCMPASRTILVNLFVLSYLSLRVHVLLAIDNADCWFHTLLVLRPASGLQRAANGKWIELIVLYGDGQAIRQQRYC